MVTIFVAFVIFAGTMFSLQIDSISNTVEMILGADVIGFSPMTSLPLPQQDMENYLNSAMKSSPSGPALVTDYSFVTFPLTQIQPANRTRFTNMVAVPRPRGTPFGLQGNYLNVRLSSSSSSSPLLLLLLLFCFCSPTLLSVPLHVAMQLNVRCSSRLLACLLACLLASCVLRSRTTSSWM